MWVPLQLGHRCLEGVGTAEEGLSTVHNVAEGTYSTVQVSFGQGMTALTGSTQPVRRSTLWGWEIGEGKGTVGEGCLLMQYVVGFSWNIWHLRLIGSMIKRSVITPTYLDCVWWKLILSNYCEWMRFSTLIEVVFYLNWNTRKMTTCICFLSMNKDSHWACSYW